MNNFFRALIAGYGAKKLGGGCLSTIVIFVVIYMLLGKCSNDVNATPIKPKIQTEQKVKITHLKLKKTA
ncbi:hypothetical protein [Mucilaginibacter myungsuensis]|uniref:Uncharacterized protein n=1 Tax=Mucilaginibacter myungsuensis TaxID=649104 RepID=A0A929KXX3_9SPHI|nr:hypothetical protein [Mucilaginibacter myungsuensis]MBE9660929.1 hypothetical protein [Mucilaginibacter myungsuensis]MDN3600975.1 hypothetical protein [Mucilaginibacter myungsuensis]